MWSRGVLDLLAVYVHDLDPVIFSITEKVKLRWYGLSYVMGFAVGYFVLLRLARRDLWVVAEERVGDVVTYVAIFGVFLGGRIGYVLFYMLPRPGGLEQILQDPLTIIAVWDGGMASHGGILGIMIVTLVYARRNKLSWTAVGDGLVIVAPLGILFGRIANFINGELYGTLTKAHNWWAVKFPKSLYEEGFDDERQSALKSAALADLDGAGELLGPYGNLRGEYDLPPQVFDQQLMPIARENPEVLQALADHTPARHPSQLYEGLLEGLVLFVLLYFLRVRFPRLWNGVTTGLFFILYAVFRILVEQVREPDAEMVLGLTKGQFYSTFMILIGVGFLIYAVRSKKGLEDAKTPASQAPAKG